MAEDQAQTQQKNEPQEKVSGGMYVVYYLVLFFAHWFGSARFDCNGDGEFDPTDVQAYFRQKGYMNRNNRRFVENPEFKVKEEKKRSRSKDGSEGGGGSVTPSEVGSTAGTSEAAAGVGALDLENPQGEPLDDAETKKHDPSRWLDRDGDGDVDFNDFFETKVSGEAAEDLALKNLATGQMKPLFILFEVLFCFLLWAVFAVINSTSEESPLQVLAGLDSLAPNTTVLRFYGLECEDERLQVWRWLSYQYTHANANHIIMNVVLLIMLGIPIEGFHGHIRTIIMFNVGVLGGTCANMLLDGHRAVVGCSGGCYALIGIHLADLVMNWFSKKFRLPTVLMLLLMIGADIGSNMASTSNNDVSHAAHIGGGIAGLVIGILVGRNLKVRWYEWIFRFIAVTILLGFFGYAIAYLMMQTEGPVSWMEQGAGEKGWCWTQQVYNKSWAPFGERFYCVRCGTTDCVQYFKNNVLLKKNVVEAECSAWDYDQNVNFTAGLFTYPAGQLMFPNASMNWSHSD